MTILSITLCVPVIGMVPPLGPASSSLTGSLSGDGVPAGYSVVNVDVDTVEGPTAVQPSVIGYVRNIDVEVATSDKSLLKALRHLGNRTSKIVDAAIARAKLVRSGLIPSSFLAFDMIGSEPNYGPFPQYNVLFEDQPIDDFYEAQRRQREPKYKSEISTDLDMMLSRTQELYERLRTALKGPMTSLSVSSQILLNAKQSHASSFYEDHEQFIENNPSPFQEITIHAESAIPTGGDAPAMPRWAFKLLDLNRTADATTYTLLDAEERLLLKKLSPIYKRSRKR
jgi:hypothetical protein